MQITVLVVLYKQTIQESRTIQTLRACKGPAHTGVLHIWDNSPNKPENTELAPAYFGNFDVCHEWHPENTPLPVLYNRVISLSTSRFIIILDQDSDLPENYLVQMISAATLNPGIKLFLPKVYTSKKLVSPGKLQIFKGKHLRNIACGESSSQNRLAITSGMMISREHASRFPFNERLKLYGVDTRFMIDFAEAESKLFIVDIVVMHDTALWNETDPEKLLPRYRNLVESWPIVFENRPVARFLAAIYRKYFGLKAALRLRDRRFLNL